VQEIINLSKLQDTDPMASAKEVQILDVVNEAIDQCETNAESHKITIDLEKSESAKVLGNREQLVMAVHNLIENAINYSPESTKVTVLIEVTEQIVEVTVKDQGIGIAQSEIDRIFERFYRVDQARSRATGGTGLGLSIVKHVAGNHGGEIKVWSVPGIGSTFSLRLPIISKVARTSK
jgi:two-component system sensor histidine kinase SenX3